MNNTNSAEKALRQSKKRRSLNLLYKKAIKKALKSKNVSRVYQAYDKAAKHGLIKLHKADRKKSQAARSFPAWTENPKEEVSRK